MTEPVFSHPDHYVPRGRTARRIAEDKATQERRQAEIDSTIIPVDPTPVEADAPETTTEETPNA